jgi:hypothetical protein
MKNNRMKRHRNNVNGEEIGKGSANSSYRKDNI